NYGYALKRPYYGFGGDSSRLTGADWHKDYSHIDYGRSPPARRVSGGYAGTDSDWARPIRTHYSMGSLATPSSSPSTYRRHMNSSFDSFRETPARYSSSTYGGDSPFRKSSYSSYTPLTNSRMGLGYSSLSGSQSWLTPTRVVIPSMSSSYSGSTSLRREPNRRISSSTELTATGNSPTYSQTLDSRHVSSASSVNSTSAVAAGQSANADDEAMDGEKDSKSTLAAVQPQEVDSASESGGESLSSSELCITSIPNKEEPEGAKGTEPQSSTEQPASSESVSSEKENDDDKGKEEEEEEEEEYHFDRNIGIQLVSANSKEDSTEELNFEPSPSLADSLADQEVDQLPAWQQFCGYDDEAPVDEPDDEADNDNQEMGQKGASSNAEESSNQFYHLCMVEPDESSAGSPEQQRKAEPWEQFCDYGYTDTDESEQEEEAQVQNQASTNNTWQQFCDYSSDEAEEEEEEEEEEEPEKETVTIPKIDIQLANDQEGSEQEAKSLKRTPEPKKLAVDSLYNSSESEETSDEDVPTLNRRVSAVQILSVSPSGSSYGGFSSSEYDSDYDTSTLSRDSRLPMFMVQKEPPEERGRVQPHLAQPAPVFSVTLDYSDLSEEDEEEEEVDSVSDYEDLSDHFADKADQTAMQSSLASSDVSEHFWTTHSDHPAAPSEYMTDDAGGSSLHSDYSDEGYWRAKDEPSEVAKADIVEAKPAIEAQYAKQMEEEEPQRSVAKDLPCDKPLPLRVGSIGEVPTDQALITEQPQCRVGVCEKLDDAAQQGGRNKAAVVRVQTKRMPDILRLEQRLVYAKQQQESWPALWANRYEWPRPKMDCAMRRVVRGVSEKAKILPMVPFHFADITMNLKRASVSVHDVKFGFPETFPSRRPPLALARMTTVPAAPLTRVSVARAPVVRQALKPSKLDKPAGIKEPDARRKSTLPGSKDEKAVAEPSKPEAQAELSFEAQLEELRRKIKKGTSAFSEQVKDLSRGIAQATTSQKQAVQTETAKSMKQEATQLAQQASDQWQQWKTNKEKKEAERLVLEKQATKATTAASPAQQPPNRRTSLANKVRLPQKVESPFFAKEKQNQAKEMVSSLPTVRKASTGGGQTQAKSISKRPEPEGESDHEHTETLSSKEAPTAVSAPSKALCKIKEQPTVQVAKLESKPVKRGEMVEQGMASSAQVKGAKVRDEPTHSLTKQANYAQLVGVKKAPECLTARVEPKKGSAVLQEPPFKWRKTKTKAKHRYNRQVCPIGDIDQLLNPKSRLRTFEQFEVFFSNCSKDVRRLSGQKTALSRKATSWPAKKVYAIDGLQDADTAFYSRTDLQRLFGLLSPTSKVPFKFDFSSARPSKPPVPDKSSAGRKQVSPSCGSKMANEDDDSLAVRAYYLNDKDPFATASSSLEPPVGIGFSLSIRTTLLDQMPSLLCTLKAPHKLDNVSLQVVTCRPGAPADYGSYLDMDMSLAEQPDELALLREKRLPTLGPPPLRTIRRCANRCVAFLRHPVGHPVRLCAVIGCPVKGRPLDRTKIQETSSCVRSFPAGFTRSSDDKDLVHEFVQNDGLACLIKVGAQADQNYQNYILRALGQVMLYVDGMNGVIAHNETIQWLYSLLGSQFRLVVKTALKLLLVFVEYTESNSLLLLAAVYIADRERGFSPWNNLMNLLNEECSDTELLIYALTLLNKTLNGVPDQDTYYDIVDALEEQGMEEAIRRLSKLRTPELSEQCRLYETVLAKEDSEESSNLNIATKRLPSRSRVGSDERRTQRQRISQQETTTTSRRPSYGTSESNSRFAVEEKPPAPKSSAFEERLKLFSSPEQTAGQPVEDEQRAMGRKGSAPKPPAPVGPLEKKRQPSTGSLFRNDSQERYGSLQESTQTTTGRPSVASLNNGGEQTSKKPVLAPPPKLPDFSNLGEPEPSPLSPTGAGSPNAGQAKRLGAVHSLAVKYQQKTAEPETPGATVAAAATTPENDDAPAGTFASALSKAKRGMDKKMAAREPIDARKESDIQWEKAVESLNRPLIVNDLDFTELNDADDKDPLCLARLHEMNQSQQNKPVTSGGMPPPPPPGGVPGPPPPPLLAGTPPPPPPSSVGSAAGRNLLAASSSPGRSPSPNPPINKDSKTVRLFWKEAQCQVIPGLLDSKGVFWQKLRPVSIDTEKLGSLFVTKTKEMAPKKKEDKRVEIRVLDTKRSNAINIGLTKLPPPRAIKTAIVKFDSSIMNKDCIEKVLSTMLPTMEEREAIMAAQAEHPDIPLGPAEQFLLMLSEIPQLHARLRLWLFMLDYANMEYEVAEPLMDLKLAMEELDKSRTFQQVMATLLSVGNFLNGAEIRGFQIDYLAKVPEVKDTVYKHSLVYHLASIMLENFPDSTDLYSEMGAVARSAKVDFDEVKTNLERMEKDCKASWDYLRQIAKHESHGLKDKISLFLSDCAQRILTLKIIHKRIINRFRKFLLYMGMPQHAVKDTKINAICKTISEFALEYRTCREKIIQQRKRQQDKRERNKTRGKLITDAKNWTHANDVAQWSDKAKAEKKHEELSRVLRTNGKAENSWNFSFPGAKTRQKIAQPSAAELRMNLTEPAESPDDEILDGLVKAATATTGEHPRERRRARQFNRKSLRRTRTLKLVEDQINGNV
ncbi:hypothetical protein M514_02589, partial [Trichuris suis]